MPYTVRVSAYPVEFFELFEKAARETVRVPKEHGFKTKKEARALSFQLQGFRNALIEDTESKNEELAILADGVTIRTVASPGMGTREERWFVVLEPRGARFEEAIRSALKD